MRSIRTRITRLIIAVILLVVALALGVSLVSIRMQEDVGSERIMSLICDASSQRINDRLALVEQSVDTVVNYVDEELDPIELEKAGVVGATGSGISLKGHDFDSRAQREFDAYLAQHVSAIESVFFSVAAQDEGVMSYYYRINPEISRENIGFLRGRDEAGNYVSRTPTDLTAFAANGYANSDWYYLPQEAGRPIWIDPYIDQGQLVEMVSFIAPIYKADTFIGVIGMDVTYDSFTEQVKDLEVLTSGYAFLTDDHGRIVYHPTLPRKMSLGDVNTELEKSASVDGGASLITYTLEGVEKKAAWRPLDNGMRLFVSAPSAEINAGWLGVTTMMLVGTVLIVLILIAAVTFEMRRITRPLEQLTEAATQIAEGNYDVNLTYDENDEVGILTNSFRHLVDNLRIRIADLYNRAYKDALTSVRNKAAYDAFAYELDNAIKHGSIDGFAVVACDCNNLKLVNDTYGHEKGDAYLRAACRAICKVFVHSPVFRVGGDEFLCILEGEDFERREELEREFWEFSENASSKAENDWDKVNIAMGMADYDPQVDTCVNDVARRADDLMYLNKNAYKARQKA